MNKHQFFLPLMLSFVLFMGCSDDKLSDEVADAIVEQVQECSRIYTTEYNIHKVLTAESDRKVSAAGFTLSLGIFGERKVVIPIDATLKGYVDMSKFSKNNVEKVDGKIVITLPDPEVMLTSTKIDQEGIRQYVTGFRDPFTDSEMANFEAEGREAVINDIPSLHIEQTARESAVRLLTPILQQMGFDEEDIIITFRKSYKPEYIIRKLD